MTNANAITKVVGYIRVSTGGQERSGLSFESQQDYIDAAAKSAGWEVVAVYTETVSGTVAPQDRPECKKALAHGLPILVAKLDRIGRDVGHIAELMKRATLKVATMPHADNFQLHLFAALAEQERKFISERTKDTLAKLKDRANAGIVEAVEKVAARTEYLAYGRTSANRALAAQAVQQRVNAFTASLGDPIELCIRRGATTLQQVADCLNQKSIPTARGGEWSSMQVSRAMKSLNMTFTVKA
ncbi:recombinase family protein [Pseudomonas syringae]|uniref:Serine recombinase n=1 Tax=Pseudomonas syringae TaxID=317 RepID=A0A085VHT3_PSESX|nr:recombinase family protein [Pseudomonas syringae]KFE54996.1 serine recombinase [Pseudomonas syringae]